MIPGRERRALGEAVPLRDRQPVALAPPALDVGGQCRGRGEKDPHRRKVGRPVHGEEEDVHRRHTVEQCDPVVRHRLGELVGNEPLLNDEQAARGDQRVHDEVLAEAVEHGHGAEPAVVGHHAEVMDGRVGVGHDVGVAEHHALRTSRRRRRVQDRRGRLAIEVKCARRPVAREGRELVGVQHVAHAGHPGARREVAGDAGRGDHGLGRGVADDVRDLLGRVRDVERERHDAELLRGVVHEDELGRVRQVHAEPIARLEAEPPEPAGEDRAGVVELAVGEAPIPRDERRPLRVVARRRLEELRDVHGISRTLPVVRRPSSARWASAASFSGNSSSVRSLSLPSWIQPRTSPARSSNSARVAT